MQDVADRLIVSARALSEAMTAVCSAGCPKVEAIYNPLEYAWEPHQNYLARFGRQSPRSLVLVGMNPGPWGMAQTGVPFGDPLMVSEWMGISGAISQPAAPHSKRPILGWRSSRSEASGRRLYGWARDRWETAERFFQTAFVTNYCPLLFLGQDGKNLTPADLPRVDLALLYEACDRALADTLTLLAPRFAVGVGRFAAGRLEAVVRAHKLDVRLGTIPHPSPANPQANRNWKESAEQALELLGVPLPTKTGC